MRLFLWFSDTVDPYYVSIIKGGGLSHTIDFHESLLWTTAKKKNREN